MIKNKKPLIFWILLTMVSLFLVGCQSSPPVQIPDEYEISGVVDVQAYPQGWEYKTLRIVNFDWGPFGYSACDSDTCFTEDGDADTLNKLNTLGLGGWDLVGIAHDANDVGAVLIFKRPLD